MTTILKIHTRRLNEEVIQNIKEQYADSELEIHVHQSLPSGETLNETTFWELIQLLDWANPEDSDAVVRPLVQALSAMPVANIYQFYDLLSEKLWMLDGRAFADAMMRDAHDDGFSADEFLYARCCVVANGKDAFESVLANPASFPVDLTFEALLYVAGEAYQMATGKEFLPIPAFNFETGGNAEAWE